MLGSEADREDLRVGNTTAHPVEHYFEGPVIARIAGAQLSKECHPQGALVRGTHGLIVSTVTSPFRNVHGISQRASIGDQDPAPPDPTAA